MAVATQSRRRGGAPPGGYDIRRFEKATYLDFGVKPFVGIRCAHCKAGLHDAAGNPRWDVIRDVVFVCQGWCRGGEGGS